MDRIHQVRRSDLIKLIGFGGAILVTIIIGAVSIGALYNYMDKSIEINRLKIANLEEELISFSDIERRVQKNTSAIDSIQVGINRITKAIEKNRKNQQEFNNKLAKAVGEINIKSITISVKLESIEEQIKKANELRDKIITLFNKITAERRQKEENGRN